MAIKATITVVRAKADTKYVSPSAIAFVNPDSKNQWFYDTYALGDVNVLVINKNLSDLIPLADDSSWNLGKNKVETLALVESFVRAVSYNRVFTDAFTLDDVSQIDKDFYGNKGNVAFITDIIGLDHNKILTDSYTVTDVINIAMLFVREFSDSTTLSDYSNYDYGKNKTEILSISEAQSKDLSNPKSDTFSLVEVYSNALAKFITDAFTLDDSALVDKDFFGNKGNVLGLTEVIAQGIAKNLTDTATITESISQDVSKSLNDSSTLSDEYQASLDKPLTDSVSFGDSVVSSIVKTVTDAFTLDDSTLIDKDYFGNKGNIIGFTEIVEQGLSKIESEIINITDVSIIDLSRVESENIGISDVSGLSNGLGKIDNLSLTESSYYEIVKVITDAFALDDTSLIDKNVDTNKGNVFSFSDESIIGFSFPKIDTFGVNDVSLLAYDMSASESINLSEITTRYSVKGIAENLTFLDQYGLQLTKNILDGFTLDDSALVDKNYFGNKGNIVSVNDLVSITKISGGGLNKVPLNVATLN